MEVKKAVFGSSIEIGTDIGTDIGKDMDTGKDTDTHIDIHIHTHIDIDTDMGSPHSSRHFPAPWPQHPLHTPKQSYIQIRKSEYLLYFHQEEHCTDENHRAQGHSWNQRNCSTNKCCPKISSPL